MTATLGNVSKKFFEEDIMKNNWQVHVQEGNVANLVFPPDNPKILRISIKKSENKTPWDIQLNRSRLYVKANHRYAVTFKARADRPRYINLGFSQAHEPWNSLGLYRNVELTSEWQHFNIDFAAAKDEDNARIHFDVGKEDVSVELSDVTLLSIPSNLNINEVYRTAKESKVNKKNKHQSLIKISPEEYDRFRLPVSSGDKIAKPIRSFCHAPFVNIDFGPNGEVSICNHYMENLSTVSGNFSVLDFWNSEELNKIRCQMLDYQLDQERCIHCIRQVVSRSFSEVFATVQFDSSASTTAEPEYPKRIIFRMKNTCNMACLMCSGDTSSRIRKQFDKLPPINPVYSEKFYQEMEEVIPHIEKVEFYGGEPFLVREHHRIFEIIRKTKAKCSIYINTNGMALNATARDYLETLNFTVIAVSMDAVSPDVHEKVRYGLKSTIFFRNLNWLINLAKRKNIFLMLNVTEHRKNWFELLEVFRFAEKKKLHIHITTCVYPTNVTLYTLPTDQLNYVLDFFKKNKKYVRIRLHKFKNKKAFNHLLTLIEGELNNRKGNWKPSGVGETSNRTDGLLASPIPGLPPFETPGKVLAEIRRMQLMLDPKCLSRMYNEMMKKVTDLADKSSKWHKVFVVLDDKIKKSI